MLRYKFILPVAYGIVAFVIIFDVGPAFQISIVKLREKMTIFELTFVSKFYDINYMVHII